MESLIPCPTGVGFFLGDGFMIRLLSCTTRKTHVFLAGKALSSRLFTVTGSGREDNAKDAGACGSIRRFRSDVDEHFERAR